ncbi:8-oxo-dGTP diphosphatase MutT [Alteromonas sp. CYL-A6]|uniref:8-oxo-dGTP diphosphatase MutT n=1 Tax=Alteromonas nitratireducens TaxID=3390813 RepID=UPI0034BA4C0C
MKQVHVAVGVVLRGTQTFVCLRAAHQHQGGKWEFPGGKVDQGETVADALGRELREEIGIRVTACQPLTTIDHHYPDKHVLLDVYTVTAFEGEPVGKEGQATRWVDINALDYADFPDANKTIIDALRER